METLKWQPVNGNTPMGTDIGVVLLMGGGGWSWAELCAPEGIDDDVAVARRALAEPARIGYDEVRRTLGL